MKRPGKENGLPKKAVAELTLDERILKIRVKVPTDPQTGGEI